MRKLSCKWPVQLTLIGFLLPIFYVFFRIGKPEIFSSTDFAQKCFEAAFISIIAWAVYGIACLFARSWVNCGNCKFSDVIQDSKEVKCRLTGYNYPITYSCKTSKPKEVDGGQ
jgi:hypothetical protein